MTDKPINLDEIVNALDSATDLGQFFYDRKSSQVHLVAEEDLAYADDDDDDEDEEEEEEEEEEDDLPEWQRQAVELARRIIADDEDRFVRLPDQFEIHEYRIIQKFCWSRPVEAVSEELSEVISGRGAFRAFRHAIGRLGLVDDWYEYRNEKFRQLARRWCEANEIPYIENPDDVKPTQHHPEDAPPTEKSRLYDRLHEELRHLLADEPDLIANAANTAALIYHSLPDLNWAGFYFLKDGRLVVGPFQGKPACTRIDLGKGVCGTAAQDRKTIVVQDVHQFPGHIACDSASNSEIVIPNQRQEHLIGLLDLDSPTPARFDDQDKAGLETLVKVFLECTHTG